MNVSVSQIYIKPGIDFPFSHLMQRRLSRELSSLVELSAEFQSRYGDDYNLVVNVSADTGIASNRVKGPTVFKKSRDIEYTVFLPYDVIARAPDGFCNALDFLLVGIRFILEQVGLDTRRLDDRKTAIIASICSDATMLSKPWPQRKSSSPT